ncbi:L-threonylcarbamoyladenylate synthase, partial [Thermoproteota archaeon]
FLPNMKVLTKDELLLEQDNHIGEVLKGAIFIHPTDTIYGIGCHAKNTKSVQKIRDLKKRPKNPFSVIAPSKEWIEENCIVNEKAREWIEKLPGPYTLILKLKNKDCVAEEVIPDTDCLGVRIPRHWFSRFVKEIGVPIVTTSVNEAGKKFMTSLEDLESEIEIEVDFMVDEGEKQGNPSNVIHLIGDDILVRDRQSGAKFDELKKI